ncbi:MAG: SCO family protein, partial [Isosphaeraceae bacterium]
VKDGALPEGLKPGDKVAGTLRITGEDSEVVELRVTERAPEADPEPVLLSSDVPPLQPGEEVPDFTLTTQEGKTLSLSDLRGKVVVLTFVYTRCPLPDVCPLMDRKFRDLADAINVLPGWSDRVRLLSVSFDPEHDTPEVLAKHARFRGATPPLWTFAVASHEELSKVAAPLGLMYAPMKTEVVHNLSTSIIGPDGRLVLKETGLKEGRAWTTGEFLKAIKPILPPLRK